MADRIRKVVHALRQAHEALNEVCAYGSCDCDIPVGDNPCVFCQCEHARDAAAVALGIPVSKTKDTECEKGYRRCISPIAMTAGQRMLAEKYGTPAEFAKACYAGYLSMDEARAAIEKYNKEWEEAQRII
jgi:hypothetical protein